jgi:hypothetical protein
MRLEPTFLLLIIFQVLLPLTSWAHYDVFVSKLDNELSQSEPSIIKVPDDYTTIQAAINAAKLGDTIQVAQGVYAENIEIKSSKQISIEGGWTQDFTTRSYDSSLTIIDGERKGRVLYIIPNLGVTVNLSIDGITIKNGTADNGGGINACANGDGIQISLSLNRCIISENSATDNGAGINLETSQGYIVASITNSTISSNRSKQFGGGLRMHSSIGGYAMLNMDNDLVQDNIVDGVDGGGIAIYAAKAGVSKLNLSNSNISRNEAPNGGGVFGYVWGQDAIVLMTLKNNLITHNTSQQGGAICSCAGQTEAILPEDGGTITWDLTNNTITSNYSSTHGAGGIKMSSGSIYGNGGLSTLNMKNDIVWGNTDDHGNQQVVISLDGKEGTSNANISYSNVGSIQTIGNAECKTDHVINLNPGFQNTAKEDYHLKKSSPCIDSGTSIGVPNNDIEGTPRPQGNGYDMGAYEYIVEPVLHIKANNQDDPVTVTSSSPISIKASLNPGEQNGKSSDWWVVYGSDLGWYSLTPAGWISGINMIATYPLFSFESVEIFNGHLPTGDYSFYFGVDMNPDGVLNEPLFFDGVQVHVTK